jgi:hypothetical protein
MHRPIVLALALIFALTTAVRAAVVTTTFENQGLAPGTYQENAGPGGKFLIDDHAFNNVYDTTFGTWSGWALSTMTDSTTPGFGNQYSAIVGSGAGGSNAYSIGFPFGFPSPDPSHPADSVIDLAGGTVPVSIDLTNTTYAYFSMKDGDGFARAFGPNDYLLLDIRGYDGLAGAGSVVGEVDFYLANFLNGNSNLVNTWETVDLSSLSNAKSLRFGLRSSDVSQFGINTPSYFAADNFRVLTVPEPGAGVLAVLLAMCVAPLVRCGRRRAAFQPTA